MRRGTKKRSEMLFEAYTYKQNTKKGTKIGRKT